jgi:hypothetical protein
MTSPEKLSLPSLGGDPPWAFFTQNLLFWPDWTYVRWYFAALNLLATVALSLWIYRVVWISQPSHALPAVAAVLAINGFSLTIQSGHMGIFCCALLGSALLLESRRSFWKHWGAGIAVGVAMADPWLTLPFALPFVLRKRWWLLLAFGSYLVLATYLVVLVSGTNPWEMVTAAVQARMQEEPSALGLLLKRLVPGLTPGLASGIAASLVFIGAVLVMTFLRRDVLGMFAVAAFSSQLWVGPQPGDDVLMMFLLVAIVLTTIERPSRLTISAAVVVGISLWLPGSLLPQSAFSGFQLATWLFGTYVVVRESHARQKAEAG